MSKLARLPIALALGIAVVLAAPTALRAQTAEPVVTGLQLSTAPRLDERGKEARGWLLLKAKLTTTDGKPVTNRSVEFYQAVELLGARQAYLGSAPTDSTGVATLVYQPAQAGKQTINLRFSGGEGYARSEGSAVIEVATVAPPFESEPLPLAQVRPWLPIGLGGVVLAAWVVLLGTFASTALALKTAPASPGWHPERPGREGRRSPIKRDRCAGGPR